MEIAKMVDVMDEEIVDASGNEILVAETETQQMTRPWRPQDADREVIKAATRRRVQSAHFGDNATFIPAKPKETINDEEHKTVAVYARVSTLSTEQVSSIENQTKYYTEKVGKKENWDLQEIYSDEGKSGTSMKRRTEFVRMLRAAKNNEFDLIITASVSRFARNVSDCIEQVRQLKTQNPRHPVGVYFETEGIYTLDPDSDQLLYIHAMLAEWESGNKSRRMILSYDQRICTGQYPVSDLLGYRHTIDGDLIIQEEEAKTVRFIFLAYFLGYSLEEIAEILTEKERPTLKGRTEWNSGMVRNIMTNERRWGDLNARKTIVVDYVKRTTVKNNQIRDAAFVEGHHEGIVSPEIAKAVKMVSASCRKYSEGVSELAVITDGALKGFVCVIPGWGGIDADTFTSISKGAYSDEEFSVLEASIAKKVEGEIPTGGYTIASGASFITPSIASITISKNALKFSKVSQDKLGKCEYIQFLYHPFYEVIIIRPCAANAVNAVRWNEDDKARLNFPAPQVCEALFEKMGWNLDDKYRFKGLLRERDGEKVLIFFLDDAQVIGKGGKATTWMSLRMNDEIKKMRRGLLDDLTGEDINYDVELVENPLIGSLPSREDILREVDELLSSM